MSFGTQPRRLRTVKILCLVVGTTSNIYVCLDGSRPLLILGTAVNCVLRFVFFMLVLRANNTVVIYYMSVVVPQQRCSSKNKKKSPDLENSIPQTMIST